MSAARIAYILLVIFPVISRAGPPVIAAGSASGRVSLTPSGPGHVSATVDDPTDPSGFHGQFIFSVSDPDGTGGQLSASVTNSNPAVAYVSPISASAPGVFTLSITALETGIATITFMVENPTSGSSNYVLNFAASDASYSPEHSRYHTGASDGSTAIAVASGCMLVASSEDGAIRLYEKENSGLPIATTLPPTGFASGIEASFRIGDRLYWIGSDGDAFSTDLIGNTPVHLNQYTGLGTDLIQWDDLRGSELGFSSSGLRIEGASLAANGTTVYLGLRAPRRNPRGHAVVVPAENLTAAVDSGSGEVSFGAPVFLDLGGRSIRSMDTTADGRVLILAGPVGTRAATETENTFKLFLWDGESSSPVPLASGVDLIAGESGGDPECVFDLPAVFENGSSVRILNDNGNTNHYGTGISSSLVGNLRKFRSDVVGIHGLPVPPLVVTTAADSGPGSLRQTVADAPNNSRIVFAPELSGQSIILTSGEIEIFLNLSIDASDAPAGVTLSGNLASRIFNVISGRSLVLSSLTLTEGSAVSGGAIHSEGDLTIENCALVENTAQTGGAIFTNNPSGLRTRLVNTTLTANSASTAGGAIYNDFGLVELVHCTLSRNSAPSGKGAGIASFGLSDTRTHVTDSIIAGNQPSNADLVGGSFNSFQESGSNLISTNTFPIPPMLAPLGDYGGITRTMPPLPNSPAINMATESLVTTDQRGVSRDALPDIGATEFRSPFDLALFWKLDFDGDGFPFGTEHALGTDPLAADPSSARNPRIHEAGPSSREIRFAGGFHDSPAGVRWILKRSHDLADFPETLFTYDTGTGLQTILTPHISIVENGSSLLVRDTTPDQPQAFYRFEAELIAP